MRWLAGFTLLSVVTSLLQEFTAEEKSCCPRKSRKTRTSNIELTGFPEVASNESKKKE